jgi:hypothetical protein
MWTNSISMWWPLSLGILLGVAGGYLLSQWRGTVSNDPVTEIGPNPVGKTAGQTAVPYQGVERRASARGIQTQDGRI